MGGFRRAAISFPHAGPPRVVHAMAAPVEPGAPAAYGARPGCGPAHPIRDLLVRPLAAPGMARALERARRRPSGDRATGPPRVHADARDAGVRLTDRVCPTDFRSPRPPAGHADPLQIRAPGDPLRYRPGPDLEASRGRYRGPLARGDDVHDGRDIGEQRGARRLSLRDRVPGGVVSVAARSRRVPVSHQLALGPSRGAGRSRAIMGTVADERALGALAGGARTPCRPRKDAGRIHPVGLGNARPSPLAQRRGLPHGERRRGRRRDDGPRSHARPRRF